MNFGALFWMSILDVYFGFPFGIARVKDSEAAAKDSEESIGRKIVCCLKIVEKEPRNSREIAEK